MRAYSMDLRERALLDSDAVGSNSVPAPFTRISLTSYGDIAFRYGRSLVSESYTSATVIMRASSGICVPVFALYPDPSNLS